MVFRNYHSTLLSILIHASFRDLLFVAHCDTLAPVNKKLHSPDPRNRWRSALFRISDLTRSSIPWTAISEGFLQHIPGWQRKTFYPVSVKAGPFYPLSFHSEPTFALSWGFASVFFLRFTRSFSTRRSKLPPWPVKPAPLSVVDNVCQLVAITLCESTCD